MRLAEGHKDEALAVELKTRLIEHLLESVSLAGKSRKGANTRLLLALEPGKSRIQALLHPLLILFFLHSLIAYI